MGAVKSHAIVCRACNGTGEMPAPRRTLATRFGMRNADRHPSNDTTAPCDYCGGAGAILPTLARPTTDYGDQEALPY